MKKIAVIGSLNMDLVVTLEKHPVPGETVKTSSYEKHIGGKGCNQAVAAAKMGADVTMVGCVGKDEDGDTILKHLQNENVNNTMVTRSKDINTGMAIVMVNEQGENEIVVISGTNEYMKTEDIDHAEKVLDACDLWVFQLEIPIDVIAYAIQKGHILGKTIILNPAPAMSLEAIDLSVIDYITPNLIELEGIADEKVTDEASIVKASEKLIKRGIKNIIVTLGEKGVFYANEKDKYYIEGKKVDVVDTTGAGDCFNGVFAAELAKETPIKTALEIAVAASALSVTQKGAQSGMPNLATVNTFLTQGKI